MKLVETGKLDLDAPVEQYLTRWHLPSPEFDHDQVTIRRILSHSAGISGGGDLGVDPGEYLPTLEEVLSGAIKKRDLGKRAHKSIEDLTGDAVEIMNKIETNRKLITSYCTHVYAI